MKTISVLRHESQLLRKRKKQYIYILLLLNAICKGLQPFILLQLPKTVLSMVEVGQPISNILLQATKLCSAALFLFCIAQWCNAVFHTEFNGFRQQALCDLNELYQKIDYQNLERADFQDETRSARRAVSDPTGVEGVCGYLAGLCPAVLTLCVYIAAFLRIQPLLAVCCILCTALSVFINWRVSYAVQESEPVFSRLEKQEDAFVGIGHSASYGKDIRLFSLARDLDREFWKVSWQIVRERQKLAGKEIRLEALSAVSDFVRDFLCYLLIAQGYFAGKLSIGDVTLCVGMMISLSSVLKEAARMMTEWVKSLENAKQYFQFMDCYSHSGKSGSLPPLSPEKTLKVEFRDVSFRYSDKSSWILRHFNLSIEAGETLALVGANGTGKSTLVKLLTGLFHPTEGEILLNGIPIEKFDSERCREMFSAVYQEPNIYAMSLLENVIGTDFGASSREKGIACLDAVGLREKVKSLPLGYDTPLLRVLDKNGVELSGGQSQRVTIARALYKNANMILLDEPTASLDARAESEIYEAFNQLTAGKTAIYVSHRLSTTSFCDHILLFTSSGAMEYGSHDELMAKKGEYYQMFKTQGAVLSE